MAEYVDDLVALTDILERCGFKILRGSFLRGDGTRARIAVVAADPKPLLWAAWTALERERRHRDGGHAPGAGGEPTGT
jgi:hypothetical protein